MTQLTPVDRVINLLSAGGYRRISVPVIVGTIPFEFAGALLGTNRAPDLVVVVDTIEEPDARIRQKLAALSRALDVVKSRRPLTAVLVGPRPQTGTLDFLGRVCRVLPIGTPVGATADAALKDWLSVLLPLSLPDPSDAVADPLGELTRALPGDVSVDVRERLVSQATEGSEAVAKGLRDLLESSLKNNAEDEDESAEA